MKMMSTFIFKEYAYFLPQARGYRPAQTLLTVPLPAFPRRRESGGKRGNDSI